MKQICIILSICFAMALTGCDCKEFNNAIKAGDTALANKDYVTAESSFRLALSKKNDPDVFKLTNQISNIIKIQQYQKDKNYDNALSLCKELEKEGFINDLIKNDIMNLKNDIEKDKSKFDEQQKEQTNQVSTVKEKDSNAKNTSTSEDSIQKAKNAIYKATETSSNSVKLTYNNPSSLGTIFTNNIKNQYYVFSGFNVSDGTEWDTYTLVDKNTFEVLEMSPMGEIYSISMSKPANNSVSESSNEPYKCLVYNDCEIDFIHGHDDEGNWTPENQNGERAYGVCMECGEGVMGNDPHPCY